MKSYADVSESLVKQSYVNFPQRKKLRTLYIGLNYSESVRVI